MKFYAVASALLLSGSAIATPKYLASSGVVHYKPRNDFHGHRTRDVSTQSNAVMARGSGSKEKADGQYYLDPNWAGAFQSGKDFTDVTASFIVPDIKSIGQASATIGLDGVDCKAGRFQAGISWNKVGSATKYTAWYMWGSYTEIPASTLPVKAGDQVKITLTSTTVSSGTVKIDNLTTAKTFSYTISKAKEELCRENVIWVLQTLEAGGGKRAPLSDFGTLTFTGASTTRGGTKLNLMGSDIIVLVDEANEKKWLTDVSYLNDKMTITYTK